MQSGREAGGKVERDLVRLEYVVVRVAVRQGKNEVVCLNKRCVYCRLTGGKRRQTTTTTSRKTRQMMMRKGLTRRQEL